MTYPPLESSLSREAVIQFMAAFGEPFPETESAAPLVFLPDLAFARANVPVTLWAHLVGGEFELRAGDAPLRVGDTITSAVRVADVEERRSGQIFTIDTASHNQRGELVGETRFRFVIPGSSTRPERRLSETLPPFVAMTGDQKTMPSIFDFVRVRQIPVDIATKQAAFRPETAAIGHAASVIVGTVGGGSWARLRRMGAKVKAAVSGGTPLVVHGKRPPKTGGPLTFEAIDQAGNKILFDGVAEILE
jgi:hypothetical protein